MGFIMYKKLLISLVVCSSIFAMDDGNEPGENRNLFLSWFRRHQECCQDNSTFRGGDEKGSEAFIVPSNQEGQRVTPVGIYCTDCKSHIRVVNKEELTEEARRHLFVVHSMLATGIEIALWIDGEGLPKEGVIKIN